MKIDLYLDRTKVPEIGCRSQRARGIMLVECVIYIAVWAVVMGLAFSAFYRAWDNAARIRRNADDIVRALSAGERWREDIRRATGPITLVTVTNAVDFALRIPQQAGEAVYFFTGVELLRRSAEDAPWVEVLGQIKSSSMIRDTRQTVTSWRWELELIAARKKALTRPLFSFQAVPQTMP